LIIFAVLTIGAKVILVDFIMRQIILIIKLLPLFKLMAQSRRGVFQVLEAQMRPLTKAIPRFIQMNLPLLPLKPIAVKANAFE
jgi:hypothetical protein